MLVPRLNETSIYFRHLCLSTYYTSLFISCPVHNFWLALVMYGTHTYYKHTEKPTHFHKELLYKTTFPLSWKRHLSSFLLDFYPTYIAIIGVSSTGDNKRIYFQFLTIHVLCKIVPTSGVGHIIKLVNTL